jgi:hypothetical protein
LMLLHALVLSMASYTMRNRRNKAIALRRAS